MLYNQSTGKTDILSLDSLIAWLERQPTDGVYNYTAARHCLLSQYFTAMGLENVSVTPCQYTLDRGMPQENAHLLPEGWETIAFGHPLLTGGETRWTFGAALARARTLQTLRVQKANVQ